MSAANIDLDAIRRDVVALASSPRSSARDGELVAARLVADHLLDVGLEPVVQVHRYQHSYALVHAAHLLAAIAGIARGGLRGALLTAAAGISLDAEASGRSQWARAFLPDDVGAGVLVRIAAAGADDGPRPTLVLAAHVDAANTGWVWHPAIVHAGARRRLATRAQSPAMGPVTVALAAGVAGALLPRRARGRRLRALAATALGAVLAGLAGVGRGATVPGASDNATGVAVLLDLARRLAVEPPHGADVVLLFPGTEEAGMGGMRAALDHPLVLAARGRGPVTVIGVDTLGAGTPIVARAEGTMRTHQFAAEAVDLVRRGARHAGVAEPEPWRLGGWTDPILAQHRGIPSTCLLSVGPDGAYTNYHLPTDTPDRIDWDSVLACARIVDGTVRAASERTA